MDGAIRAKQKEFLQQRIEDVPEGSSVSLTFDVQDRPSNEVMDMGSNSPPLNEQDFLKEVPNHSELSHKLARLSLSADSANRIEDYANHVGECWYVLAEVHLREAESAVTSGCLRSAYSRAYYAAYNASKAVRYLVSGFVSLRADDHKKAQDLPDDFPHVDRFARLITDLYSDRLLADYDNWGSTGSNFTMNARQSVTLASEFLSVAALYINGKRGLQL